MLDVKVAVVAFVVSLCDLLAAFCCNGVNTHQLSPALASLKFCYSSLTICIIHDAIQQHVSAVGPNIRVYRHTSEVL
jgi:hypothetical protein